MKGPVAPAMPEAQNPKGWRDRKSNRTRMRAARAVVTQAPSHPKAYFSKRRCIDIMRSWGLPRVWAAKPLQHVP